MLCVWAQYGCDPGRVSDGLARGWHCAKLSPSSALLLSFSDMCFVLLFLHVCRFCRVFLKKNQNAPRPSEYPPVRGGGNVRTFVFVFMLSFGALY